MAVSLKEHKAALVLRSELLRRSLALQLEPVRRCAGLAQTGMDLARGLGDLLVSRRETRRR
jgi:hypothetical protein